MNVKKIALVTGGSRGLGRNIATHLAQQGIDVLLTYHTNSTQADEVVAEINKLGQKAVAFQLDTSNVSSFDRFYQELEAYLLKVYGEIHFDYLINNAGTGMYASFVDTTEAQFDAMTDIHLKGVFFMSQKALKYLNDGGRIINVSTGLARFSLPGYAAYASVKGGVEVLSRYMAKELGARKITVNVVAPGAIETDFGGGHVRDNKELNAFVSSVTALGRAGIPDDIGGVVAFLCSEASRWITGQRIEVSGGMFL